MITAEIIPVWLFASNSFFHLISLQKGSWAPAISVPMEKYPFTTFKNFFLKIWHQLTAFLLLQELWQQANIVSLSSLSFQVSVGLTPVALSLSPPCQAHGHLFSWTSAWRQWTGVHCAGVITSDNTDVLFPWHIMSLFFQPHPDFCSCCCEKDQLFNSQQYCQDDVVNTLFWWNWDNPKGTEHMWCRILSDALSDVSGGRGVIFRFIPCCAVSV